VKCGIVLCCRSVKLYSCTYNDADRLRKLPLMSSSKLVCRLIESVQEFWSMKVSAEFVRVVGLVSS